MRSFLVVLLALSTALPPARAEDASAPSAAALQAAVDAWIAGIAGMDPGKLALRIEPDGDHYRAVMPFKAKTGTGEPAEARALVRSLPGGAWQVGNLTVPQTLVFGDPPGQTTVRIGQQAGNGLIDPSLSNQSLMQINADDMSVDAEKDGKRSHIHIGRYLATGSLAPGTDGRLDARHDAIADKVVVETHEPGKPDGMMRANRMAITAKLDGADKDQFRPLLVAATEAAAAFGHAVETATNDAPDAAKSMTPLQRERLRALISAVAVFVRGAEIEESVDGLELRDGAQDLNWPHAALGGGGGSRGDSWRVWLFLAMEGSTQPGAQSAGFEPRHIEVRPALTGTGPAELAALLDLAVDDVAPAAMIPRAQALLRRGPVTLTVEPLNVDLGLVALDGRAEVAMAALDNLEARAHLSVRNLDALIAVAQTAPNMQQALGPLLIAKTLGRKTGDRTEWDISYTVADGLAVNGVYPLAPPGTQH